MRSDLARIVVLSMTVAVCTIAKVADASHILLTPGDMPTWDMDLRFIEYGSSFGFNSDSVANVETMLGASVVNVGPDTGLVQIEKSDSPGGDFVYSGLGGTSGTWQNNGLFNVLYMVVKAGGNEKFALYELKVSKNSGPWNTENISTGGSHNVPDVSHLSYYGDGSKVPEPSSVMALVSLAGVGLFWGGHRRRKRSRK